MTSVLRLSVGADVAGVAEVNAAFGDFAQSRAVPAEVRRSVQVALDELLTNTIQYGGETETGEISVEFDLRPDRLAVTISDNGAPFDPASQSAPDTSLSVDERPLGGLGLHLARRLVDDLQYHRRDDRNVVIITKRLPMDTAARYRAGGAGGFMELSKAQQGDAWVVRIAGNLDSVSSPSAQRELDSLVSTGARKIAVDFSSLDYISSAGLRVLLGTAKQLNAKGGGLRTFGLNRTVREVFDISGFSAILPVFDSEAEALARF